MLKNSEMMTRWLLFISKLPNANLLLNTEVRKKANKTTIRTKNKEFITKIIVN